MLQLLNLIAGMYPTSNPPLFPSPLLPHHKAAPLHALYMLLGYHATLPPCHPATLPPCHAATQSCYHYHSSTQRRSIPLLTHPLLCFICICFPSSPFFQVSKVYIERRVPRHHLLLRPHSLSVFRAAML